MEKEKLNKQFSKQLILYYIFSGSAAFVNIAARVVFSKYFNIGFYLAVILAYMVGMFVNFILNKKFNFPKGPRKSYQEFRSFVLVASLGMVLTTGLSIIFLVIFNKISFLFVNGHINETISHITAVGIVSLYSFFAHKFFSFKQGVRYGIIKALKKTDKYI